MFRAARPALTSVWGRSWPEMVRSRSCSSIPFRFPFLFVLLFYFSFLSFFDYQIGRIRVTATTPSISYFPFHFSSFRFGLVRWRSAGGIGWLESPSASLPFVGTNLPSQWVPRPSTAVNARWTSDLETSSSLSFYRPYLCVWFFKTLFEEPPLHPNRMAYLAMANSIRLSGVLGWDFSSKSYAVPDIDSRGCSCSLLDGGQIMCRWVLLLL